MKFLRGRERLCPEGCKRNTEAALEVFASDFGCRFPFAIVMGKGVDVAALAAVDTPVLVVGGCAVEECAPALRERLGPNRVFTSPGCNNLSVTCGALLSLMGVPALKVARMNPLRAAALLGKAKLNRSTALVTPILPMKVRR